jgi:hypothetical protein
MSVFTPSNGTPKDVYNQLGNMKGIDPEDPNDTAFKLVTVLVYFLCKKNSTFFVFCEQHQHLPHVGDNNGDKCRELTGLTII